MFTRIGFLLLGFIMLIPPAYRFSTGKPTFLWGQHVSALGEIGFLALGISLIYLSIFKPKSLVKKMYICPKCEDIINITESGSINCNVCGTKMEELKGFYERHSDSEKRER